MYTVVIVSPLKRILGRFESEERAVAAAAAFAVNNGAITIWVFDPEGNFIA